jgi:glycerol-1-phosphatase
VAAIATLTAAGRAVAYASNNAARRAEDVADLLRSVGVPATVAQAATSAQASAALLARRVPAGSPVLVVGAPALAEEVAAHGLRPVHSASDQPVAVVQGYGPDVGFAQLAEACVAVRSGALWVATNLDLTQPSPRGPLPGNGSLVGVVTATLGRGPDIVAGKPEPELFLATAARYGARQPLVVGDRLDTDIAGATRAGMASLLVLTGVTTPADLLAAPAGQRPTYCSTDLSGLSTEVDRVRVPDWPPGDTATGGSQPAGIRLHGWTVSTAEPGRLVLGGHGVPVDALRALAAAAWHHPQWSELVGAGEPARAALDALGLTHDRAGAR